MNNCKLKASLYNIYTYNDSGELLIYNTLYGKYLKISRGHAKNVEQIVRGEKILLEDDIVLFKLLEEKVIVEEACDEYKIAKMHYNEMIYGNNMLDITIIPTDACNFRCIYCYEAEKSNYMDNTTENGIIKFLERNIKYYRHLVISWFGGEPLLCIEQICRIMRKIMKCAKKNGVAVMSNMTTNGYLLDINNFKSLLAVNVRNFQITIDGPQEIHNIQRPHKVYSNSFEMIMKNLLDIKNECKNERFEIKIRINISKQVQPYREEYLEVMEKAFLHDEHFVMDFEWVRDWGGRIKEQEHSIATSPISCKDWLYSAIERGLRCSDFMNGSCAMFFCEACKSNGFIINYDGNIHKCTLAIENSKYKEINNIGYITKRGYMVIDDDKKACWLVSQERDVCKLCALFPICMGINCPWVTSIQGKEQCMPLKELVTTYLYALDKNNKFRMII